MNNIKFSIIIPAYNVEKYIEKCINSILEQDYTNYEIIVVDDCSTDNTLNILKKYKEIKILSTPKNSRQGAARNIGLNNCTGDYILFVDADDSLYDKNVIGNIAKTINNNNPDIVYMGMEMYGKREMILMPNEENCKKEYRLAENRFINAVSICWKNELIQKNRIRFPEKIRYEDVYFAFLGIEKANTYAYTDFISYKYYNREDSTTTNYSVEQVIDTIKLIEKMFELFDVIDKENIPYLKARINQQVSRVPVRLERAVNQKLNNIEE